MLTFEDRRRVAGGGFVNNLINNLPFEIHIPNYQYCGPGTKLHKRLKRGDQGINLLDSACKQHDLAYAKNKTLDDRHKADYLLENRAWERVKSKDASLGEKAAAWFVTTGMKLKRKLGMGCCNTNKKKNKTKSGGQIGHQRQRQRRRQRHRRQHRPPPRQHSFQNGLIKKISSNLNNNNKIDLSTDKNIKKSSIEALKVARAVLKRSGVNKKNIRIPRIIPFQKKGGILPLLPVLAALGSLGTLLGGASGVAKTIIDAKNAKKKLEEQKRHNQTMEMIGKKGEGLFLKKRLNGGFGLYLKKKKTSNYQ